MAQRFAPNDGRITGPGPFGSIPPTPTILYSKLPSTISFSRPDTRVAPEQTIVWIDPNKETPGNEQILSFIKLYEGDKSFPIKLFRFFSNEEFQSWLQQEDTIRLLRLSGKYFRFMTHMVTVHEREYDTGLLRARLLRSMGCISPIMIYCGSPERADRALSQLTGAIVTGAEVYAACFSTFGPHNGFASCKMAMICHALNAVTSGWFVSGDTSYEELRELQARNPSAPWIGYLNAFKDKSMLARHYHLKREHVNIQNQNSASRCFRWCEERLLSTMHFPRCTNNRLPNLLDVSIDTLYLHTSPFAERRFFNKLDSDEQELRQLSRPPPSFDDIPSLKSACHDIPEFPFSNPMLLWHYLPEKFEVPFSVFGERDFGTDVPMTSPEHFARRIPEMFTTTPGFFRPFTTADGRKLNRIWLSWVIVKNPTVVPMHMMKNTRVTRSDMYAVDENTGADIFIPEDDLMTILPIFSMDVNFNNFNKE